MKISFGEEAVDNMTEKSPSAPTFEKKSLAFQVGDDGGRGTSNKSNKKRRRGKKQIREQCHESVASVESLELSTDVDCDAKPRSGIAKLHSTDEGTVVSTAEKEMATEENGRNAEIMDAGAANETVAEGTVDVPRNETVAGKRKELLDAGVDEHDNSAEIKTKKEEDKSDEQQKTGKKKKNLLSLRRPKKNKAQKSKQEGQSGELTKETENCANVQGESGSSAAKSKDDGNEGNEDKEGSEPTGDANPKEEIVNSPEDGVSAENNEEQIGEHENAREADAASSSHKAKKFKPLQNFRRQKKKADAPKNTKEVEQPAENGETSDELKAANEEEEKSDDPVANNENKTDQNEDAKKKKKKKGLRGFRKSAKAEKKSAVGGASDSAAGSKEESDPKKDAAEESGEKAESHREDVVASDPSKERPEAENAEVFPEPENQGECNADSEKTATSTKKTKKGLLHRRMKKIWAPSGKSKQSASAEKEESAANEGAESASSEQPEIPAEGAPSPPAAETAPGEDGATETLAAVEQVGNLEETSPVEDPENPASRDDSVQSDAIDKKEDETPAGVEDNSESGKQVKRKGSVLEKISNAFKKKKTGKDVGEEGDEEESQGIAEQHPAGSPEVGPPEVGPVEGEEQPLVDNNPVNAGDSVENAAGNEIQEAEGTEESSLRTDEAAATEPPRENEGDMQDYNEHVQLMKPVIQELHEKLVQIRVVPPSEPAEAEVDAEKESELATFSDDYSLTEVTNTTVYDSNPSIADICIDDQDGAQNQQTGQENVMDVIHDVTPNDQKTDVAMAADGASDPVPNNPEEKPQPETSEVATPTCQTDVNAAPIPVVAADGPSDPVPKKPEEKPQPETSEVVTPTCQTDVNAAPIPVVAADGPSDPVPKKPEEEKPQPEEISEVVIPTCQTEANAAPTPKKVPSASDVEPSGTLKSSEDAGVPKSQDAVEGNNDQKEEGQEEQQPPMANPGDLTASDAGQTSDLDSSQTVPSKGRREEWILVNPLEVPQDLSHHLKVLALENFEHGPRACCTLM